MNIREADIRPQQFDDLRMEARAGCGVAAVASRHVRCRQLPGLPRPGRPRRLREAGIPLGPLRRLHDRVHESAALARNSRRILRAVQTAMTAPLWITGPSTPAIGGRYGGPVPHNSSYTTP